MAKDVNEGAADEQAHEPTETELQTLATWYRLGRRALGLEPPVERRKLREIMSECATLVIIEAWLANGQNRTRTAQDLGISRRVVRNAVNAWHKARRAQSEESKRSTP